jgi:hypothetical protein
MAISIKKYVDITSGVGGSGAVRQRDLIGRLFTTNPKVPAGAVVEIESADDALLYFGSSSEEYARAVFYFSFISKLIVAPQKLSYARWANAADVPRIYGSKITATLASFVAIAAGTLMITAGANTANLTAMDFTAATSFADVAAIVQTAVRAATGTQFATALVTYDAIAGAFNFAGTVAETAPVSVTVTGTANDIAGKFGWGTTAVFSPGVDITPLSDTLTASADLNNNFGSFLFIPTLTDDQDIEVATWNGARNVEFMYCDRLNDTNMVARSAALIGVAGWAGTYAPTTGEFDEMCPMIIMAATDYTKRNSVQNYMFQQFPTLTPKVSTTAQSDQLDPLRVNYYGVTQTAGQQIAFYQRGVLGGGSTAPVDMNTYANELWLKDRAASDILSLLLSLARISANVEGNGQIIGIVQQGAVDQGLFNGVISVGKTLTTQQKLYIASITGDDLAYSQIQNIGYWLTCEMQSYVTTDSRTEYKAVYTLVYSKDDDIRKVEGTHILI